MNSALYESYLALLAKGRRKDAGIDRQSSEVCEALLRSLLDYFCYAGHEWPAGILWGNDGATLDQCNEIMSEVTLARELDRRRANALSINEFESKLKHYKERLDV